MLINIINLLLVGRFVLTPEMLGKRLAVGIEDELNNRRANAIPERRIEEICRDFEETIRSLIGNNPDIAVWTFEIGKIENKTLYILDADSPTGEISIPLPDEVIIYDINRFVMGKAGKKDFAKLSIESLKDKLPIIIGIIGDLQYKEEGTFEIKKLEQVFYLGTAGK